MSAPRIGVPAAPHNVRVRDYWHLTECVVAMCLDEFEDRDCTCLDYSPYWSSW